MSRLTSRFQTVIPKSVRDELGLKPGDLLHYRIEPDSVILERAKHRDEADPFAVFTEWAGEEDEKAYRSLGADRE